MEKCIRVFCLLYKSANRMEHTGGQFDFSFTLFSLYIAFVVVVVVVTSINISTRIKFLLYFF